MRATTSCMSVITSIRKPASTPSLSAITIWTWASPPWPGLSNKTLISLCLSANLIAGPPLEGLFHPAALFVRKGIRIGVSASQHQGRFANHRIIIYRSQILYRQRITSSLPSALSATYSSFSVTSVTASAHTAPLSESPVMSNWLVPCPEEACS